MITFQQFVSLCEVYDKEVMSSSQITRAGEGGRVGRLRKKTAAERKKAEYKPRKDIGTQRQRSTREQQPEKERGSAALSPKEAQRKAYLERKARESGQKQAKSAAELLRKKEAPKAAHPDYKPQKAKLTGKEGRAKRQEITRAGQEKLEKLVRKSESEKQGIPPEKVKLTGGKEGEAETKKTGKPYKYRSWS
jgi:hypothetical protein